MTSFYDAPTFYKGFFYCQNLSREEVLGVVIEARNLWVFAELFFKLGTISRISRKYLFRPLVKFSRFSWFLAWKGSWKSRHKNGLEHFLLCLLIKPSDSESEIRNRQKRIVLFLCLSPYAYPRASNRLNAIFRMISLESSLWVIYQNVIFISQF